MQYRDISTDTQTVYRLAANEKMVFFMLNRTGDITIELAGSGAAAHVFAFYTEDAGADRSLRLAQKHLAPDTVSSALVKVAVTGKDSFHYDGAIEIAKAAHRSDASQESRALLLSPMARASARPSLEILAHDVVCHHAATTAPLSDEALFFAASRGLSEKQATKLLVNGFFQDALQKMEGLIGKEKA
ncbi:MAG: SufD family Fe-S cluster assembly protein [Candidatus Moraniibacteriota bacterium]